MEPPPRCLPINSRSPGKKSPRPGVAPATTQANLQTIITASNSNETVANQAAMNAMYYALAAANPTVPFLDLYQRWNKDYTTQSALGWQYDTTHPNQYGYSDWASMVASLLLNP